MRKASPRLNPLMIVALLVQLPRPELGFCRGRVTARHRFSSSPRTLPRLAPSHADAVVHAWINASPVRMPRRSGHPKGTEPEGPDHRTGRASTELEFEPTIP